MKNLIQPLVLPLLVGAMLASTTVRAMPLSRTAADYGTLVVSANVDRHITINAHTSYVNVTNGETVRFDINGKSFTFTFDAWPNDDSVELSVIAPSGLAVPNVRVYIAASPLYQS